MGDWISVNEKLPKTLGGSSHWSRDVLVHTNQKIYIACWDRDFEEWYMEGDEPVPHPVTHWMPLPEDPNV